MEEQTLTPQQAKTVNARQQAKRTFARRRAEKAIAELVSQGATITGRTITIRQGATVTDYTITLPTDTP